MEGCAVARHARDGETACGRALADRARRQCGRYVPGTPWRPAVFLVCRGEEAGGGSMACDADAGAGGSRVRPDHARDQSTSRQAGWTRLLGNDHLAFTRYVESRDGGSVLRLDREAVRRSAGRGAVVAGAARGGARPLAQFPVQSSGAQRRRQDLPPSGLRRSSLHLTRLLRVQDGAALRVLEVLAWWRRQGAELPAMVQPAQRGRGASPSPVARDAAHPTCREWLFRVLERTGAARAAGSAGAQADRSEEHTSELQSLAYLVCRL